MTERFIIAARKKGTSYNLPLTRKQKKKNSRAMNEIPSNRSKICCPLRPHFERKMFPVFLLSKMNEILPYWLRILFAFRDQNSVFFFPGFFLRSGSAIRFGFFVDFYLLLLNFSRLASLSFRPHYFPSIDFRSIIISTVSRDLHGTFSKPWRRQLKVCGKTKDLISRIKA